MRGTAVRWLFLGALFACERPHSTLLIASASPFQATGADAQPASLTWTEDHVLRVCADPDNLPFSNLAEQGVENRLAELLAADLHARLEYTWWPQRRGTARHPLKSRKCDVVLTLPSTFEAAQPIPYYRSTYVFVTRRAGPAIESLDDPGLRRLRIAMSRPEPALAEALARRGLSPNVVLYRLSPDSSGESPLWRALESGEADVAIVWGPLAGYFNKLGRAEFLLRPVPPANGLPPLSSAVAAGVRVDDTPRRRLLEAAFARHASAIRQLLLEYGFPLLDSESGTRASQAPPR